MYRDDDQPSPIPFETSAEKIINNAEKVYEKSINKIIKKLETYTSKGSGWVFSHSGKLILNIDKYVPFAGGSQVKLPDVLKSKKSLLNIMSNDDQCFKWCVTRHFNKVYNHAERVSNLLKEQAEKFDPTNIKFPVKIESIRKFEKANGISVNVYGYENEVYPLKVSKCVKNKHVDLVYNY